MPRKKKSRVVVAAGRGGGGAAGGSATAVGSGPSVAAERSTTKGGPGANIIKAGPSTSKTAAATAGPSERLAVVKIKKSFEPVGTVIRMGGMADQIHLWLDELNGCCGKGGARMEKIEAVRCLTARLNEKTGRDADKVLEAIVMHPEGIRILLKVAENFQDTVTYVSLLSFLRMCVAGNTVSSTWKNVAANQMVAHSATPLLLSMAFPPNNKNSKIPETTFMDLLWILGAVSQKDSHFSTRARLQCSIRKAHSLLKETLENLRLAYPTLQIIKAISKTVPSAHVLAKDGVMITLEKLIGYFGLSPCTRLQLTLDVVARLTKSKVACGSIVKSNLLVLLTRVLSSWNHGTGRAQVRMLRSILLCLSHVTMTKAGRRSVSSHAIPHLRDFVQRCPNERTFDPLLIRSCHIILRCAGRQQLPIPSTESPVKILLPTQTVISESSMSLASARGLYGMLESKKIHRVCQDTTSVGSSDGGESSEEESEDEEDMEAGMADEDDENNDDEGGECEPEKTFSCPSPMFQGDTRRSISDLSQYLVFLPNYASSCPESCKEDQSALDSSFQVLEGAIGGTPRFMSQPSKALWTPPANSLLGLEVVGKSCMPSQIFPEQFPRGTYVVDLSLPPEDSELPTMLQFLLSRTKNTDDALICSWIGTRIRTMVPVVKLAHPDYHPGAKREPLSKHKKKTEADYPFLPRRDSKHHGHQQHKMDPLLEKDRSVCRGKLISSVLRLSSSPKPSITAVGQPDAALNLPKTVFDLDFLLAQSSFDDGMKKEKIGNQDATMLGEIDSSRGHLMFESRFESGNLRKAIQTGPREYDLILSPDVNSSKHLQWFYFEVGNMQARVPYTFNVINCEKQNSQFNFGMQPVIYSVYEAMSSFPCWRRVGDSICYYRNGYQTSPQNCGCNYYTASFTVTFKHTGDVCYIAYHFPYTYTRLMLDIWRWHHMSHSVGVTFTANPLCRTLNGNEVPVLSLTAADERSKAKCSRQRRHSHGESFSRSGSESEDQDQDEEEEGGPRKDSSKREVIVVTARVHPGEANSSWIVKGFLDYLLSGADDAMHLLKCYVVQVVPMLNVEGVINGCHRCGLTNEDLNRQWHSPSELSHPEIYHTKGLLECLVRVVNRRPVVFCDFHGHSRRKNVFLYGCCRQKSWLNKDHEYPQSVCEFLALPRMMLKVSPAFCLQSCCFDVEKARESTARVTVWRELGVARAYTLESTYCGCDQGPYKGKQLGTRQLEEIGAAFGKALGLLNERDGVEWGSEGSVSFDEVPKRETSMSFKHIDDLSDSDEYEDE